MKQVLEPYFWNLIHTTERECEMAGKLTLAICETLADLRFFLTVCVVSLAGNQQSSGRILCSVWFGLFWFKLLSLYFSNILQVYHAPKVLLLRTALNYIYLLWNRC